MESIIEMANQARVRMFSINLRIETGDYVI